MTSQNTVLILVPTVVTPAIAATAISAASNAYSSRSCPWSRGIRLRSMCTTNGSFMDAPIAGRRRVGAASRPALDELGRNLVEVCCHVGAGQRDGGHRD